MKDFPLNQAIGTTLRFYPFFKHFALIFFQKVIRCNEWTIKIQ